MPQSYTPRGFAIDADFTQQDYQGSPERAFTVQESSLATERKVWIGSGSDRAHLNEAEARMVRDALTEFLGDGDVAESHPALAAQSEEVLAQGIYDEMTFVSTPESRMDVARDWARELIASGVVQVAPSLVAESREAVIEALTRGVEETSGDIHYLSDGEAEWVADALLAPGGPVQVVEVTAEQAWDECQAATSEAWFRDAGYGNVQLPENPYDGFTRKEQTGGE